MRVVRLILLGTFDPATFEEELTGCSSLDFCVVSTPSFSVLF